MLLALLLLISPQQQPPLERITYDLELAVDSRLYHLRMVVNKLDDSRFSISCRKSPGGALFTYWATQQQDVVAFPRSKMMFEGNAGSRFRLFPEGPQLTRDQWLHLLEEGVTDQIEGFLYTQVDGRHLIRSQQHNLTIRWKERERKTKTKYRSVVLEPERAADWELVPLSELALRWSADDLDQ